MHERRCGQQTLLAPAADGKLVALPLRCKQWSCGHCGPRLKRKLVRRFVAGNPTTLLTLTCNPAPYPTRLAAFRDLSRKVNMLMKRLRRRYPGAEIQYGLVWEITKKGWPHAHLLLRAPFLPQKLLSNLWQELTGAWGVDIRAVPTQGHAAHYVTKYLGKNPQVPPGQKRYRLSRAYSIQPPALKLRDFLDCGSFTITRYTLPALELSITQADFTLHRWFDWLTVFYPKEPP